MRRACDNPFAVHRVLAQRYRLARKGWETLHHRFEQLGHRGAIIGEHGRGKTTLLEDYCARLANDGWAIHWFRFDDRARHLGPLSPFTSTDIIACDGVEQLSWWDWRRLRRASRDAGGLLITTHRPGRLPTVHRCESSETLLEEIVFSLDANVSPARVRALYHDHAGNVRDAIRALYDVWAVQHT